MPTYIHWFRRDLRLRDNPALHAALRASGGQVVPLFILDDAILRAQPYFRIFNPTSQGEKFDPQGEYVRRYVPELANVPDRYIHTPWAMPVAEQQRANIQIGRDYPAPIVDHARQRERALAMYRMARTKNKAQSTHSSS
jgi:deoxyribodipyrimidine photolyase